MTELDAAEAARVAAGNAVGERTVWRITFNPASFRGIRMMPLRERGAIEEVRNGEDRIGFLPRPFYERAVHGVGN